MNRKTLAITCILIYSTWTSQLAADTSPLQGVNVFDISYASNPEISPDGQWVLYHHVSAEQADDQFRRSLICHHISNKGSCEVLKGFRITTAAWHPDSGFFVVSATRDGQSYALFVQAGKRRAFKKVLIDAPMKNITWHPSGKAFVFDSFVAKKQDRLVEIPEMAAAGDWAPPVIEIQRDIYRRDGQGYLKHGNDQIHIYRYPQHDIQQLTESEFDNTGPYCWNGTTEVLYSGQLYENWEHSPRQSYIYRLNIETQNVQKLIDIEGPVSNPQTIREGNSVAFLGFQDRKLSYQQRDLFIYDNKTGESRNVSLNFDRDITDLASCPKGKVFFRYDDRGVGKIGSYNPETEELTQDVARNIGGVSIGRPYQGGSFSVSETGVLAYPKASLTRPPEIEISSEGVTTLISTVTHTFTTQHQICDVERFTYKSSYDSESIDGWVVLPPDYDHESDRKYPLILEIHGGPFANYGSRFAMEPQLYAAAGYVVVYTNPRGSTSYGERFAQLINNNYPQQGDYEDLMTAVDYAIDNYSANPNRLYVTGGSGGGILTAWIVTKTDRFKAAVSQKPVINWETLAYTSDGYFYFTQYWFDGPPTARPADYRRRSPLTYVDKVITPTMLMTGEQDWRTPITEAEQFYQGLKLHHVDTMLVRVPESSHAIAARPSRIMMKLRYLTAWFEQYK